MPIFGNKFQVPKRPSRKKLSFHTEKDPPPKDQPLVLHLGEESSEFVRGSWIPITGDSGKMYKECELLQRKSQQLKEENNLLKMKIEILLDMLTEETLKAEGKNFKTYNV